MPLPPLQEILTQFSLATYGLTTSLTHSADNNALWENYEAIIKHCFTYYQEFQALGTTVAAATGKSPLSLPRGPWDDVIRGAAAYASAARHAAFQERCAKNLPTGPFGDVKISFKFTSAQLFRELSHIAPGTHGWIFAVSAKMEHDLLNSESYPFWLTYSDGDHTPTVSYGRYRAIRWFEADMAGPEFLHLDGKVRELLVQSLSSTAPGAPKFNEIMQAIAMSQRSVVCIFLQCVTTPTGTERPVQLQQWVSHKNDAPIDLLMGNASHQESNSVAEDSRRFSAPAIFPSTQGISDRYRRPPGSIPVINPNSPTPTNDVPVERTPEVYPTTQLLRPDSNIWFRQHTHSSSFNREFGNSRGGNITAPNATIIPQNSASSSHLAHSNDQTNAVVSRVQDQNRNPYGPRTNSFAPLAVPLAPPMDSRAPVGFPNPQWGTPTEEIHRRRLEKERVEPVI